MGVMKEIEREITQSVKELYGKELVAMLSETPDTTLGDYGTPVCMRLSKITGKKPDEIAEEIKNRIKHELVSGIEFCRGYLNVKLDRKAVLERLLYEQMEFERKGEKIIVEHTSVNPNKSMHIGHLRNACLGDSLARLLRVLGYEVETHNYVDDTGNQVAITLLGLIGKENLDKLDDENFLGGLRKELEEIASRTYLDEYCWDVYTKTFAEFSDEDMKEALRKIMERLENPASPLHNFAKWFAEKILECHLELLKELGITFDLLPRESDILALGFWKSAFEILKKSEHFVFEEEGKHKGCWVIKLSRHSAFSGMKEPDKVIVKSDGTVTYTGKDIAYHFWKFGILGKDFYYRMFLPEKFPHTWVSESKKELAEKPEKNFGKADKVINVIDIRQKYAQDVVKYSLELLGYKKQAANCVHYGYEVVVLSAKSVELAESSGKKFVHMSGRKGIGIKARDLLEIMKQKLAEELKKRGESEVLSHELARGALRYYMVKQNISRILVFDFDEALCFEGDSGIYLMYALVRAKHILSNATKEPSVKDLEEEEWKLVRKLAKWRDIVEEAGEKLDITILTDYANELAKEFTNFYHSCRVVGTEREEVRLAIVKAFIKVFSKILEIIGIPDIEKM